MNNMVNDDGTINIENYIQEYNERLNKTIGDLIADDCKGITNITALPYSTNVCYIINVDRDKYDRDQILNIANGFKRFLGDDKKFSITEKDIDISVLTKNELKQRMNHLQLIYDSMED